MPALKIEDTWRYLGFNFTPTGRVKIDPTLDLRTKLYRLTRASVKSQQRLHAVGVCGHTTAPLCDVLG